MLERDLFKQTQSSSARTIKKVTIWENGSKEERQREEERPGTDLATDMAVRRLSPVTMTHRMLAFFSWLMTGVVSGFSVFCMIRNPRKVRSDSIWKKILSIKKVVYLNWSYICHTNTPDNKLTTYITQIIKQDDSPSTL